MAHDNAALDDGRPGALRWRSYCRTISGSAAGRRTMIVATRADSRCADTEARRRKPAARAGSNGWFSVSRPARRRPPRAPPCRRRPRTERPSASNGVSDCPATPPRSQPGLYSPTVTTHVVVDLVLPLGAQLGAWHPLRRREHLEHRREVRRPALTTGARMADLAGSVQGTRTGVGLSRLRRGRLARAPRRIFGPARGASSARHAATVSAQSRTHAARGARPARSVRSSATVRRRPRPGGPTRQAESGVQATTVAGASFRGPALPSPARPSRESRGPVRRGTRKKADPAC